MEYLLEDLQCFEDLVRGTEEEPSKLKERLKRLRSAANLAFDKGKCDQAVQSLRTANDDLKRLHEQALDLQPRRKRPSNDREANITPRTFRHEFDSRGPQTHRPTELATFDDILQHPVETSISMVDQLKLARTIVSAVLYFSSTPWLAEYWGMKDLCFFLDRNDLATSLRTLNLGVRFLGTDAAQLEGTMEGIDSPSDKQDSPSAIDDAMLLHGIRNVTLHSLGVVLLQIGRWSRVEPDDILQVRRLAQQVPRLGPKYHDLVQKCLNCDFGCGSNLSRPQLQQAVYEDVVEELDAMIKCLDISSDDGAP
ncbi:hypothetical protein NKR19_g5034 [Coniochaeta hoffmannii]|uniref:DUF7580 domain-containing protein n=1 Tax=Coniochaeta hoffmannii TaxID=91930 RepID=A0AA38RLP8_9PEZI|nr:hypothetical protein NKR19_g5034 [Coniochaeta hoffmannii]